MSAVRHSVAPFAVQETQSGFLIFDYVGDSIGALALETGDHPYEEQRANAHLFGTAPELLAALKGLQAVRPVDWADGEDPEYAAAWAAADAAVLLAEPAQ